MQHKSFEHKRMYTDEHAGHHYVAPHLFRTLMGCHLLYAVAIRASLLHKNGNLTPSSYKQSGSLEFLVHPPSHPHQNIWCWIKSGLE